METIKDTIVEAAQGPAGNRRSNGKGVAAFVAAGVLVWLILAVSWAPDSRMTALLWVPDWIARLADRDPNIRTAIPFIPLAFLLTWGFAWRGWKSPVMGSMLVCGACLGAAELGQLFLPARTADVADLMWGAAGIAVGLVLAWVARWWLLELRERKRLNREGAKVAKGRGGRR